MTHVLRKGERVSSIVVFIAIIGMSIWSSTYEGRQATFPLIVCASLVVLGLLDLFLGHRAKAQAPTEAKEEENEGHPVARQLVSIGWLVGFLGLIALVGFLVAIPLYTFAFMVVMGRQTMARSALVAAVATGFVYTMFVWLLSYQLEGGLLFG
jgi:hypothetical protein